ncbi:MAG: hypothetical protein MI974_21645 [Chitinophagales bacterium]|nr:hypothetical protein [Chitinophagales bacterium]
MHEKTSLIDTVANGLDERTATNEGRIFTKSFALAHRIYSSGVVRKVIKEP